MGSIDRDVNRDLTNPGEKMTADEELIRRILGGNTEDFSVLVERYQSMVFGMIMRQVRSRDIADEIAQETFIKAYKNLSGFRSQAKFGTWLIRIALNQTSNFFSSKRFKESRQTISLDVEKHDRARENEDGQTTRETLFPRALGALTPKFRDVLTLCGYEGKSYEEAALILDVPVGTIRSRLNRARLMLKREIEQLEAEVL